MREKTIMGLLFLTMIFIFSIGLVQAVDVTTCGLYNTPNTEYNIINDIPFDVNSSGVESLGGTSNSGALNGQYYTCIRILNADNVTINGHGYNIVGTNKSVVPYDLPMYLSNTTNVVIKNLNIKDAYHGVFGVEENFLGANRNCYNTNTVFDNINFTNIQYAGIRFGCNVNTLASPIPNGLYASNINVYNSSNVASLGFFDFRNIDKIYFSNVNFYNISKYAIPSNYKFYFNALSGFGINNSYEENSNIMSYRVNVAYNGYINNIVGVNSATKITLSSSENVTSTNWNVNGFQTPINTTQENRGILWTGSSGNGTKDITYNNIHYENIFTNSSFIDTSTTVTANNKNVNYNNITVENSVFYASGTVSKPFIFLTSKNNNVVINGLTTRNVTIKDRFIAVDSINTTLNNLDIDYKYLSSGHIVSSVICVDCNSQNIFNRLYIQNSVIHTPITVFTGTNLEYPEWFASEHRGNGVTTFTNVQAFTTYIPFNASYSKTLLGYDVTPFMVSNLTTGTGEIEPTSSNNTGWFPKDWEHPATELNGGTLETQWTDLALYNRTNDLLVDNTTTPYTYYSSNVYRLFNNDIGSITSRSFAYSCDGVENTSLTDLNDTYNYYNFPQSDITQANGVIEYTSGYNNTACKLTNEAYIQNTPLGSFGINLTNLQDFSQCLYVYNDNTESEITTLGGYNEEYFVQHRIENSILHLDIISQSTSLYSDMINATLTNGWNGICNQYNYTTKNMTLYVNGNYIESKVFNNVDLRYNDIVLSFGSFFILNPTETSIFDEYQFYNYSLTPTELQTLSSVVCNENWVKTNTDCSVAPYTNRTITYTDTNMCGTTNNLPVDNGTTYQCNMLNPIKVVKPVCDTKYYTGTNGETNITINFEWTLPENYTQNTSIGNQIYYVASLCDRFNLESCHPINSGYPVTIINNTLFNGTFNLDVSALTGDFYTTLEVYQGDNNGSTGVIASYTNNTCYITICEGSQCTTPAISGFVIHEVDTTDLTNMIIALLIIVITIGLGFGLWMGVRGKQTDGEYAKWVYIIVGAVVVIAMIFLTLAILYG